MLDFYDHPFLMDGQYKRINHLTYEGLFDGLDIDWEWNASDVTPELSQAFTQFIKELKRLLVLREQSQGKESLLTVALQVTPKIYKGLELSQLTQHIDWFHVMAYDFFGPNNTNIGFNAPVCGQASVYSVDGALQRIMEQGVSPQKMVLGLPLYGYLYENTDGYNALISKQDKTKAISYHLIKSKYLDNPSYKKTWNEFELIPSLYSKDDRTFISYDGQESLVKKVEFAKDKRMQGVVLWRLSGDDAQHSMVDVIVQAMKR
jgi:chitinase